MRCSVHVVISRKWTYRRSSEKYTVNRYLGVFLQELQPSIGPKSLYLATLLCLTPPAEGFPWDISVKFYVDVNGRPMYQMPYKKLPKITTA